MSRLFIKIISILDTLGIFQYGYYIIKINVQRGGIFKVRIKELRQKINLTQEELGAKIGQTKSNISKHERGMLEPGIETLKLLRVISKI